MKVSNKGSFCLTRVDRYLGRCDYDKERERERERERVSKKVTQFNVTL